MQSTIFTIGHSNKDSQAIIDLLQTYSIDTLIDARSIPYSKHNPQFNRQDFKNLCEANKIKYEWRGNNIGGLDRNVYFDETCKELVERASKDERIAVMCSEGSHTQCHRHFTIQPKLEEYGAIVAHIQQDGAIIPPQIGLGL